MTVKYFIDTHKQMMALEWRIYYAGNINWVIGQASLENHALFIMSSNL